MGIAAYNRGTRSIALGIEMDSYAKQGKIHPSLRPTKEPVPRPDTWGDKTREKATAKARSVLRYWLSRGNGAPSLDTLADMVQCDSRFTREVAIHAATTALEELAEPPKPNTVTEARSARLAPVTALDSQWSGNDKAAFGSWNTLDGWSFTFEVRLQPLAVKRETWAATVSFFPPGDSRKWVMRQNFSDRDYAREWCERAAWDAKHDAAKPNGRFGVGALVGAQYRRPSSNQPWHHPRYSGDPADPGHGWTGEVIAYNDPRLWANTLQFPDRTPTQAEVDAHLAHYAEVVRQSPPHVQRALREERVPVLWEYGSASLEDETGLFGVAGPVQRKRNGVRGVKDSVRMRLTRMRDEGAPLIVAMEEEGLRVNQPFSLLMLDEALSSEVMQDAVDALTGEYGNAWEDLVFADGTRIDDPGATMLTVHEIKSKPGGLQGTTYSYDVTVSFPMDGRYKPNGRRQRDDATLDLFAARAQPRLLPAATQPRMATLEDLATAPLGSLLTTRDRTVAYRHATAGKSGWVPQKPSASSPDGWADRGGPQSHGTRLFRVLTDMMAREAFYLSPPVFVAAKRNAARVLRGREIAREALRKLSNVERFRERGDWSRGEEAHVWIVSENRPVDVQIIISRRATSPDSVRFGRREWDFDRYHHVDVVGMSPDAASQKIADALAAFIRTYRTDKEIERDDEMGIEDVPLTYGVVGEMPESVRDAINAELARDVGGTVHFRSIGAAVAKCAEILARYGYEWGQVINSLTFLRDTGHTSFEIARTNTRDLFSPAQVDDVALAFQWHKFDTGNVEVVAYVSRGKANSAARRRRRRGAR